MEAEQSGTVKSNQTYENIVFDHRAGDRRVLQLLSVTEERGDCGNDHGCDDPRDVDHGQEDHDREEDDDREEGFDRSVAIGLAEEEGRG